MDKDILHKYNGILLSHQRNEIMPFAVTLMDLETVIQSEVSQKDKNKCRKCCLFVESREMVQMNLLAK